MAMVSLHIVFSRILVDRCVRRKESSGIGVVFRFAVWYINSTNGIYKENIDETIFMFALFKCRKSDKE